MSSMLTYFITCKRDGEPMGCFYGDEEEAVNGAIENYNRHRTTSDGLGVWIRRFEGKWTYPVRPIDDGWRGHVMKNPDGTVNISRFDLNDLRKIGLLLEDEPKGNERKRRM